MIIILKGTFGSGKSYLANLLINDLGARAGKLCASDEVDTAMISDEYHTIIYGFYNKSKGGADGLGKRGYTSDKLYSSIDLMHELGWNCFIEGVPVNVDANRILKLAQNHEVHVFMLNTDLETCIVNRAKRRKSRGTRSVFTDGSPQDRYNVEKKLLNVETSFDKIKAANICATYFVSQEDAYATIRGFLLRKTSPPKSID